MIRNTCNSRDFLYTLMFRFDLRITKTSRCQIRRGIGRTGKQSVSSWGVQVFRPVSEFSEVVLHGRSCVGDVVPKPSE